MRAESPHDPASVNGDFTSASPVGSTSLLLVTPFGACFSFFHALPCFAWQASVSLPPYATSRRIGTSTVSRIQRCASLIGDAIDIDRPRSVRRPPLDPFTIQSARIELKTRQDEPTLQARFNLPTGRAFSSGY
ncbi:TPA: hypothetical protein QDC59_002810 [Burkholderia cenocepacia]|nr:hypothetical protein [Burkholderia cenocepacia]